MKNHKLWPIFFLFVFLLNLPSCSTVSTVKSDGRYDYNRLITSIQRGNIEDVKACINAGVDVDRREKDSNNALIVAAASNRLEIVRLLLARGADVNVPGYNDMTALHYRVHAHHFLKEENLQEEIYESEEIMKLLLGNGADIWQENKPGQSVIDLAEDDQELIRFLKGE